MFFFERFCRVLIKKKKKKELEKIKDIMGGVEPLDLVKFYVDPQSQEINPADSADEDFNVSRQSTFEKFNDFFGWRFPFFSL